MNVLKVNKIYKRNIKHVYAKNISKRNYIVSGLLTVVLLFCCLSINGANVSAEFNSIIAKVYNPINQLFNDEGGIVFTGNNNVLADNKTLKFITPIKCSNITKFNGELNYEIDSNIMVVAPEAGVIKEIGVLPNNEKYIEIEHSKNIVSRIENVYIVGVVSGQIVNKGKDIATVKLGEVVRFMLFENGVKQTNLSINNNEIIWKN